MSQSSLVNYRDYSAHHWNDRKGNGIKRIVIHHCAGVLSVEQVGQIFRSKPGSSTYAIGYDGRVGQYVPEEYRPWTTSGWEPDRNCITIEVSNSSVGGDWPVSDKVLAKLIDLVTDICKRNGLRLNYTGDKRGNLLMHKWYASTACPGPYLASKFPYIASEVNKRLDSKPAPVKPAFVPIKSVPYAVFRLYNSKNGDHLFTADVKEANSIKKAGWKDEGIAWYHDDKGDPVYRVYNPNSREHFYTASKKEKDGLIKLGWRDEKVAFGSGKGSPVYRLLNPVPNGKHFFTTSAKEKDTLLKAGWKDEGIAFKTK